MRIVLFSLILIRKNIYIFFVVVVAEKKKAMELAGFVSRTSGRALQAVLPDVALIIVCMFTAPFIVTP